MKYSGVAPRFAAILVDLVVTVPLFVVMAMAFGGKEGDASDGSASASLSLTGLPFVVYLLIILGYYVATERMWGRTLGKMVVGVRVVTADGGRISWGQALGRNLLRIVDVFPIAYLLGAIVIWVTPKNQRIGDLAASTFVVTKDSLVEPVDGDAPHELVG